MTLPSVRSRGKPEQIGVFDYTDEEERVEEMSKKLLRKFDSPVTKSSAIDKYDFLRFCKCFLLSIFSQGGFCYVEFAFVGVWGTDF